MIDYIQFTDFYFDLDRTIWDCTDKYSNKIWAKQILYPFEKISDTTIIDECQSKCVLDSDIIEYLTYLKNNGKRVHYISRGGRAITQHNIQPSILLMRAFQIYELFESRGTLFHKDIAQNKKSQYIPKQIKCVFFDDNDLEIEDVKQNINTALCIRRDQFKNWKDLIK
jgi:predicted phosphatase